MTVTTTTRKPRNFRSIVIDTEAGRDAETIDRAHRKQGWKKNAWHIVITDGGRIQSPEDCTKVRGYHEASATVGSCGAGYNSETFGICLTAECSKAPTVEQEQTLRKLLPELLERFDLPPGSIYTRQELYDQCPKANGKKANCPTLEIPKVLAPATSETPRPGRHKVVRGDTLENVAAQYGLTVDELCKFNRFPDPEAVRLLIGQVLHLTDD